jgi:hypothetical protein
MGGSMENKPAFSLLNSAGGKRDATARFLSIDFLLASYLQFHKKVNRRTILQNSSG